MTTLAAPAGNEIQNTLAASYTRGTDTTITLVDGTEFANSAHVVRISNADNTKWCLIIYTTKATHVLTMGGGATDYALAKNVTVGDEAHEFAIGSTVEVVCAADEIAQEMNSAIHDDIGGEITAITEKTIPVANDEFLIEDSASSDAKKSLKLANFNYRYIEYRVLDKDVSHTVATVGGEFRCPQAMTVLGTGAYCDTAGVTDTTTIDIHDDGTTIMETNKISLETTEKTSLDAAQQPVVSAASVAADSIMTFHIDAIASGTAGKGLVVWMKVLLTQA